MVQGSFAKKFEAVLVTFHQRHGLDHHNYGQHHGVGCDYCCRFCCSMVLVWEYNILTVITKDLVLKEAQIVSMKALPLAFISLHVVDIFMGVGIDTLLHVLHGHASRYLWQ